MFALLAINAVACDEVTGPRSLPDASPYVVGAAEAALDAAGRFVFEDSVRTDGKQRIEFPRAIGLALAYVRTYWTVDVGLGGGEGLKTWMQLQRGAPIDSALLKAESRAVWAHSAYSVPDSIPRFVQKRSGPYAIVRLLERGIPVITVAVSGLNTHYRIDGGGRIMLNSPHASDGEGFHVAGISVDAVYEDPISPEEAVEAVYRATGRQVSAVPVLLFPPIGLGLSFAKWRIQLEGPVTVTVDGIREVTTNVLYVGDWPAVGQTTLFVAATEQPLEFRLPWDDPVTGEPTTLVIPVRGDIPVEFERVTHIAR